MRVILLARVKHQKLEKGASLKPLKYFKDYFDATYYSLNVTELLLFEN